MDGTGLAEGETREPKLVCEVPHMGDVTGLEVSWYVGGLMSWRQGKTIRIFPCLRKVDFWVGRLSNITATFPG